MNQLTRIERIHEERTAKIEQRRSAPVVKPGAKRLTWLSEQVAAYEKKLGIAGTRAIRALKICLGVNSIGELNLDQYRDFVRGMDKMEKLIAKVQS